MGCRTGTRVLGVGVSDRFWLFNQTLNRAQKWFNSVHCGLRDWDTCAGSGAGTRSHRADCSCALCIGTRVFTKTYIGTKFYFNASVSASAHHMLKTTQSVLTKGCRNKNATISQEAKVIKVQGDGSRLRYNLSLWTSSGLTLMNIYSSSSCLPCGLPY